MLLPPTKYLHYKQNCRFGKIKFFHLKHSVLTAALDTASTNLFIMFYPNASCQSSSFTPIPYLSCQKKLSTTQSALPCSLYWTLGLLWGDTSVSTAITPITVPYLGSHLSVLAFCLSDPGVLATSGLFLFLCFRHFIFCSRFTQHLCSQYSLFGKWCSLDLSFQH